MKKKKLLIVTLLWAITGGMYAMYWLYRVGVDFYKTDELHRYKLILPRAMILLLTVHIILVILVLGIGIGELRDQFNWFFIFGIVCIVIVYIFAFEIIGDIANVLCNIEGHQRLCSPVLAVILTFFGFASIIYLQAIINKRLGGI